MVNLSWFKANSNKLYVVVKGQIMFEYGRAKLGHPSGTRVRLPSKPAHEPSNGPKLPVSDVCAVVL